MKLKVRDFRMNMHMNLGPRGHSYLYQGYIDAPGHPQDGIQINQTKHSPKKKGEKVTVQYFLKGGKEYDTLDELMKAYDLPAMQDPAVDKNKII